MGRRGGKKAAQRSEPDPEGEYAKSRRTELASANKRRAAGGRGTAHRIAAYFDEAFFETGNYPNVGEAATHFGVSERTVQRALAKSGIELPPGRKKVTSHKQYTVPLPPGQWLGFCFVVG